MMRPEEFSRYSILQGKDLSMTDSSPPKVGRLRTKFDTGLLPVDSKQPLHYAAE